MEKHSKQNQTRKRRKGDFERNCSGGIGGTDDQPVVNRVTNRQIAVNMAFVTPWEAQQSNVPQHALRSVTAEQIIQAAQVITDGSCEVFATPVTKQHVKNSLNSKKATFKKDLGHFGVFHGCYVPVGH
jgi:hypothetical protein